MSEQKQEIGYYNNSTRQVIPGFNALFNALSKSHKDVDENNQVKHIENIDGSPREISINLGGQFKLDRQHRGGVRLWTRIYDEQDLIEKMSILGATIVPAENEEDEDESESAFD